MSFTIDWIDEVIFEPCVGWPKEVDYSTLPEGTDKFVVVNGCFESSLTGEMKLDNFTGYVTITYGQIGGMCGDSEDRAERASTIEKNHEKVALAYQAYKKVKTVK